MELSRAIIAPILGFVGLQLHRYMILPWSMEVLLTMALVLPYMSGPKKTCEIGVQTDSDEIIVSSKDRFPIEKMLIASGVIGLTLAVLCQTF